SELARIIEQQFRDRVPLSPHVIDRAPLRALESANMPAILVEMGYLTNAEQEKQLTGNEFQNTLVQALVEAALRFRDYLNARRRRSGPAARSRRGSAVWPTMGCG